jgi:hypothetical protein
MGDYLTRQPIKVLIKPFDIERSMAFVKTMRRDKDQKSVRDLAFDRKNTSEGINKVGHLGEVAVARVLGIEYDTNVRTEGDGGLDLQLGYVRIQVKTSELDKLIFNNVGAFDADVAVLVQYVGSDKKNPENDPKFLVWGWITRDEFLSTCYKHDFGYGERLVLRSGSLKSLSSLMTYAGFI